jgi:N-acetylmuramate 1-kinase
MTEPDQLENFLLTQGWGTAQREPFPADWSQRRYQRLTRDDKNLPRAILMLAPPDGDFINFVRIAGLLRQVGASAPRIFAADTLQGFMLLEDFGDRNFGRLIDAGTAPHALLLRATDVLIALHRGDVLARSKNFSLPAYDAARLIALLQPLLEHYVPASGGKIDTTNAAAFREIWQELLVPIAALPTTLILRDFMADNLMDLSAAPFARNDWQAVGLLDFELAGVGSVAYDIASLTEQVRRDLPAAVCEDVIAHYLQAMPQLDAAQFRQAVAVLSVQRHLRILGVLSRVVAERPEAAGKRAYFPRIVGHIKAQMQHPAHASRFEPLQKWLKTNLPEF